MKKSSSQRLQFSTLTLALLCCCAAMMFSSCSKKAGSAIVGKWEVQGKKNTIVEFKPDGTMINNEGTESSTGKYTFSDDTHMKIEMSVPKGEQPPPGMKMTDSITIDCVVTIAGDDLAMDVTMNMPGIPDSQSHKENVHMKRVK